MNRLLFIVPTFLSFACINVGIPIEQEDSDIHIVDEDIDDKEEWLPKKRQLVIYLNFEGGTLEQGKCGKPQKDITCIKGLEGDFDPWDGDEDIQDEVIEEVEYLWSDYDVKVTRERPVEDDYVMVVMSAIPEYNESRVERGLKKIGGIAPSDCGNKRQSDTVHVFSSSDRDPDRLARLITHEVGHSLGFGHMADRDQIMKSSPGDRFTDGCLEIIEHPCEERVWGFCQDGWMNPHMELMGLVGAAK